MMASSSCQTVEPLDPVFLSDPAGQLIVVSLVDLPPDLPLASLVSGQCLFAVGLALSVTPR